jgi:hypothetical protein
MSGELNMSDQITPAPDVLPPEATTSSVGLYEWAEKAAKMSQNAADTHFHEWVPVHAGKYFEPVVTGYMTAPVGFHYGKAMEARTITTTDIIAFRDQCATWIAEGKQVFFYMAIWYPSQHVFYKADPTTYEPVECDPPVFIEGKWKIRYALLDQ